jgi:hypothetical protein
MSGFAQIPAGTVGRCINSFDFTGVFGDTTYYTSFLPGPTEGPFELVSDPNILSWSPCGGSTAIMNMNTQCYISPTQSPALIAVCPNMSD